ncbi:MAG TPA: hypothetical protein VMV09_07865, partial [Candidatus Saccharimonadales bacterium]|nr:hypothetical protein [Candidatus Saccharimonadales bacterium]
LQARRDTATHRFLVPHEHETLESGPFVERLTWREFRGESIAQLEVARSALIYVVAAVDSLERASTQGGGILEQRPMTN